MKTKEMISSLKKMGVSEVEIANVLSVSVTTIYRWKKGTVPHRTFRDKLFNLYRVRGKKWAYKIYNRALSSGKLKCPNRSICELCKKDYILPLIGHHDDYSKPLKVRWVCPSCHSKIHIDQKEL